MPASGRPPVETVSNQVDADGSSSVFASICSPSSLQKPNYREQVLQSFFTPEISNYEVEQVQVYLVELFADAGLYFRLVERQSFRRFVEKIYPGASKHLPGRTTLSGPLLEKRGEISELAMLAHIKEQLDDGRNAGFVSDGWKYASKKHVDGLILTLGCFTFAIDSIKGDSEHDRIAVARGIEKIITKLEAGYDVNSEGWWPPIPIKYYCSDDVGQQERARQILVQRLPHILWVRCYAHQINLMVKALLNKPLFCESLEQASGAAKWVNTSSSK